MRICIIIPAYNEEATLAAVIRDVQAHAPHAETIVINDASSDSTAHIPAQLGVPVINLPINLGIGGAVQTGMKYAVRHQCDIAVQVDGDGQHDPQFIPRLVAPIIEQTADIVIGSRFLQRVGYTSSLLRLFGIRFFAWLIGIMTNQRIFDATSGFRAYNRAALVFAADHYPSDFPEPESIVTFIRNGFRVHEVPVAARERQGGVSSVRISKGVYFVVTNALAIILSTFKRKMR